MKNSEISWPCNDLQGFFFGYADYYTTFTDIINQLLPEPHAGLLAGILFGTKTTISRDLYQSLVATGTLHIIALSGMNITILESLVSLTLQKFFSRRVTSAITIVVIIGFVWFVGASASVIRAAVMGSLALLAVIFGKQQWSFYSFLITIGIMLIVKPDWIGDLSFQLSAGATLGIILFGNKIVDRRPEIVDKKELNNQPGFLPSTIYYLRSFIDDSLRITLAAQVFTIPLIFFTFHRVSLVSPLTNILIGWVIAPLTAVGLVVVTLGWIFLPLGYVVSWVAWVFLEYLILAITWTSKLPFASLGG